MKRQLRQKAEKTARDQGFSTLQDAVRLLLQKFAKKEIRVEIASREERLSPKAERRYAKIVEEIKSGKAKTVTFTNVGDMMKYLNS